jgi:alanyl-tRNA synthetase
MRRRVKLVPTKRLYHSDPLLMEFTCEVLQCQPATGNSSPTPLYEVITDVTAFYPNSGGQPADRGTLDGADVVDVIERGDTIVHITPAEVPLGPTVGRIDIERRFDHMQQHSGQHILSSAFETLFGLETVGFHLGEEYVTIDLNSPEVSPDQLAAAERLACEVVFQNRPVEAKFWDPQSIDWSRLRKPTSRTENIRLVEIADFDLSPCGGTHVRATGEVGLIKITRTEKVRNVTRVEFVCGRRALSDYRLKNSAALCAAAALSVGVSELPDAVQRLLAQVREVRRAHEHARAELDQYRAERMYNEARAMGESGIRLVTQVSDSATMDQLKSLAQRVCQMPSAVALMASTATGNPQLVFARSQDVDLDVARLLRDVLPELEGKGGGTPFLAQGGGKRLDRLGHVMNLASELAAGLARRPESE